MRARRGGLTTKATKSARRRLWIALAAIGVVALVTFHRIVLSDFRRLEAAYVQTRQPTACAFDRLAREIDPREADPELITEELPGFLEEASGDLEDETARIRSIDVVAFPPLRHAKTAVAEQGEEAIDLYQAMLLTPNESRDELQRFTAAKNRAEKELSDVRVWLVVSPGRGWDERSDCTPPRT